LDALLRVLRPATCVDDAVGALCLASERGFERAVDLLLEGDGTPLSCLTAPCAGGHEVAALMAAVHAEAVDRRAPGPVTRLQVAYFALLETRSARIAARLLDWAPEVEPEHIFSLVFSQVHSLVHYACEMRRAGVVTEILARRGALPGFRAAMLDRDDASRRNTPLHEALRAESKGDGEDAEQTAVVRALLDAGAWHSPINDDKTPLRLAAERGRASCVRLLLEAGADPNEMSEVCGSGPLHCAARMCSPDVARALLEAGADPNLRDRHGRTALHCARSKEVVEVLVQAGARLDAGLA
jgi:hypothetical protein